MTALTSAGRDVLLAGEKLVGHIGWNSFFPFERAFTLGEDVWQTAIDHAASVGSKVIRVPITPRYKNNLQTYVWTVASTTYTLRASYIARVIEMLDYALARGVYLMIVPFFRYPDAADVVGATVSTTGDRASLARDYMRQILAQMITAFGAHPGVAAWCLSNEVENYAWGTGGTISANAGLGTPASYSLPADHLNLRGVWDWHSEHAAQIRVADRTAFIINGHGGNSRVAYANIGATYWRAKKTLYPKGMSAVSVHAYWNRDGSNRTTESYRALLDRYMAWAGSRPLIVDETGESASSDPSGSQVQAMLTAAVEVGVPLILDWQLCPLAQDPTFGVWPGEARWEQRVELVRAANAKQVSAGVYFPREQAPGRPSFEQCALFGPGGTGQISIPDGAHMSPLVFTATAWVRPFFGTSGSTYRRVLEKVSSAPYAKGWKLLHTPGSHVSNYGPAYGSVNCNNGAAATDVNTNGAIIQGHIGRWAHYAMTFDGTTIWTYFNGIPYGNPVTVPDGYVYEPAATPLLIGQSSAFIGEISDVRLFDRVLTQAEIGTVLRGAAVDVGCVGWWPLDGDAQDQSSYGNHGEVSGTVSFGEHPQRRTPSNDSDPWGTT